jgi:hypothetical protein
MWRLHMWQQPGPPTLTSLEQQLHQLNTTSSNCQLQQCPCRLLAVLLHLLLLGIHEAAGCCAAAAAAAAAAPAVMVTLAARGIVLPLFALHQQLKQLQATRGCCVVQRRETKHI